MNNKELQGNIMSPYVKHILETFLNSGRTFSDTVKLQPQFKTLNETLNKMNTKEISNLIVKMLEEIDNKKIPSEKIPETKLYMAVLLAEILEHVRTLDEKSKQDEGR